MKITIATPTFGQSSYLNECKKSVHDQTLSTFHSICCGTPEEKVGYKTVQAQLITQTPDPGMVSCWSLAASNAETMYLGFLADDNSLEPSFSEKMVHFLERHPDCDLVFCNQSQMDADGNTDFEKSKEFSRFFGRDILPSGLVDRRYYAGMIEKGAIPLETCVVRKSLWEVHAPFSQQSKGSFDHEFICRLLISGISVGFIPEYLANFRIHEGAYSSRQKKEHLIGSIWTYENLNAVNSEYRSICKSKSTSYKGRLLRYQLDSAERVRIMKSLIREKNGLTLILKNSLIRLLGVFKLYKTYT